MYFWITCAKYACALQRHYSLLLYSVVAAEVVNTENTSDVVFPAHPNQLDNFTTVRMDEAVRITIPADAITRLATGNTNAG